MKLFLAYKVRQLRKLNARKQFFYSGSSCTLARLILWGSIEHFQGPLPRLGSGKQPSNSFRRSTTAPFQAPFQAPTECFNQPGKTSKPRPHPRPPIPPLRYSRRCAMPKSAWREARFASHPRPAHSRTPPNAPIEPQNLALVTVRLTTNPNWQSNLAFHSVIALHLHRQRVPPIRPVAAPRLELGIPCPFAPCPFANAQDPGRIPATNHLLR
jgi:hypothetical protein